MGARVSGDTVQCASKGDGASKDPERRESTLRVSFHVTGFGKFRGVPDNPTTHLVEALPAVLEARGIKHEVVAKSESGNHPPAKVNGPSADATFELQSRAVLHVSAGKGGREVRELHARVNGHTMDEGRTASSDQGVEGVENGIEPPREQISAHDADASGGSASDEKGRQISVFVHCGVDGGSRKFALETCGYNEATFRVPDEMGETPLFKPVDESNPDITHVRKTTLPIPLIMSRLSRMGWGQKYVRKSSSAGRFVCNYVYYTSLGLCEAAASRAACEDSTEQGQQEGQSVRQCTIPRHSLFLHVPPFNVIPKEKQIAFLIDCLEAIAEELKAAASTAEDAAGSAAAESVPSSSSSSSSSCAPILPSSSRLPSPLPASNSPWQPAKPLETPPSPSEFSRTDSSRRGSLGSPSRHVQLSLPGVPSPSIWETSVPERESFSRQETSADEQDASDDDMDLSDGFVKELETEFEATRRSLIEAGFEELDVDAAMSTTISDDVEVNMQFLLDVSPLLPQGSPACGDVRELRKFLTNASERRIVERKVTGGVLELPRAGEAGRRSRAGSLGSRPSMGGVSPRWAREGSPRVMEGISVSPGGKIDIASPSAPTTSLLQKLRRHRKISSFGEVPSRATGFSSRESREYPKPKPRTTGLVSPSNARPPESPEYLRRTTGNAHSQSSSMSLVPSVSRPRSESSAGWGSIFSAGSNLGLVLVVRLDLGMGPGAVAAQCCRAALAATRKAEASGASNDLAVWRDSGETTVVLAARDATELNAVLEVGTSSKLPVTMVREKGAGWSTDVMSADKCTVAAVGPAPMTAMYSSLKTLPVL